MKKNTMRYIINATMFIDMCSISVIGLLLGFIIPKGRDGHLFGLHRHEWGDLHLYLSLFFCVLLSFHIYLNRKWITNATKRYFGENSHKALLFFSMAWIIVLFIGCIIIKVL